MNYSDIMIPDPNWLAVRVMLIALPAVEILDFIYSGAPQMPPGQVIVVNIAAITYLVRQKRYGLPLLWFVISLLWISALMVAHRQMAGNLVPG